MDFHSSVKTHTPLIDLKKCEKLFTQDYSSSEEYSKMMKIYEDSQKYINVDAKVRDGQRSNEFHMKIIFKDTSACICTKSSPFWNELDKSVLVTLACVMAIGVCLTFMIIILIFILTRKLFSSFHKN